jgi:Erv1 / Alr family
MNDFQKTFDFMNRLHDSGVDIPKKAGPPTWRYLHTLAKLTSPDSLSQDAAFETLKQVVNTFPCKSCAEHGAEYISRHPFSGDLVQYVCDFHNAVNEHTGKPTHSCDIDVLAQDGNFVVGTKSTVTEISDGKGDVIVESVPYFGGSVGVSIPLFPGGPDINFDVDSDWPFTVLPLPRNVIRRLSNPPIPPPSDNPEESEESEPSAPPRPPTPRELFNEVWGIKNANK